MIKVILKNSNITTYLIMPSQVHLPESSFGWIWIGWYPGIPCYTANKKHGNACLCIAVLYGDYFYSILVNILIFA